MTSVVASNLGTDVTEKQVTDFFSFCGKIQTLKLEADGDKQKATITFERPSAARTALLLQDAHLGTSQVHVSSSVPLDGTSTPPGTTEKSKTDTEFSQEDKPRTAIVAEYLSHGYTLTDQALQKAIDVDHTHGISKRFYGLLNNVLGTAHGVDQKFGVTQKAVAVDEKYAIQEKAKNTATGLMRYFESALDSPTGKKVRSFYDDSRKQALDIHAEARRLADERKGTTTGPSSSTTEPSSSTTETPSSAPTTTTTTGLGATAPTSEK